MEKPGAHTDSHNEKCTQRITQRKGHAHTHTHKRTKADMGVSTQTDHYEIACVPECFCVCMPLLCHCCVSVWSCVPCARWRPKCLLTSAQVRLDEWQAPPQQWLGPACLSLSPLQPVRRETLLKPSPCEATQVLPRGVASATSGFWQRLVPAHAV